METCKIGNEVFKIVQDNYSQETSREWDNLGIMYCKHKKYGLGDHGILIEQIKKATSECESWSEVMTILKKDFKAIEILPLYLYDHSGISISAGKEYPFNDRWDSMTIGFIFTTEEKIKEMGVNKKNNEIKDQLEAEVETYNMDLNGVKYGYQHIKIKKCKCCEHETEEVIDSCGGFYGYDVKKSGIYDAMPEKFQKALDQGKFKEVV
jgi:hypothetical protein